MADNSPPYSHVGRKHPAKGVRISLQEPTIVWLTVCSQDRAEWMAASSVMESLHGIWESDARAWLVGDYLLMPDHLHLFCAPYDMRFTIERWMAFWKDRFWKLNRNPEWKWQTGGFHHRLRSRDEYREKHAYMVENPVRKGLVDDPDDWPYRGRAHELRW